MEDKKDITKWKITIVGIFLVTLLCACFAGYFYGLDANQWISFVSLTTINVFIFIFCFTQELMERKWMHDNANYPFRFLVIFVICLCVSIYLPLLPAEGWIYPVVSVLVALCSNTLVGIMATLLFVSISTVLAQAALNVFLLFFICGVVSILMFARTDQKFKVGIPMIVTLVSLFTATTAMKLLFLPQRFSLEIFIVPAINLFSTGILLLIVLKIVSSMIIHKRQNRLTVISDQEYELLRMLKEKEKDTYFHTIHCVHFCERIAERLAMDVSLVKSVAYYHRIGDLFKDAESLESELEQVGHEHKFPPELIRFLKQYAKVDAGGIMEKETTVVYLSAVVIAQIRQLISQKKEEPILYTQVIAQIFREQIEEGNLAKSKITVEELMVVRQIFQEENLYYDFLR